MKLKRHFMRKKEIKGFRDQITATLSDRAGKLIQGSVEIVETDEFTLVLIDGDRAFVRINDTIVPYLGRLVEDDLGMGKVAVDRGAIPYVTNGADVMRPGIVRCDPSVAPDDLVVIVDENHQRPLAVGRALFPAAELAGGSGKGVKIIHYVGDEVWTFTEV